MAAYRLTTFARSQIETILIHSQENFGDIVRERYAALLVAAMQDVAATPRQTAVAWRETSSGPIGIYHVRASRKHIANPPGIVGNPRHYLIFRIGADDIVDILGFIHDSMLFERALRRLTKDHPV